MFVAWDSLRSDWQGHTKCWIDAKYPNWQRPENWMHARDCLVCFAREVESL